jgi:hypothetical protein
MGKNLREVLRGETKNKIILIRTYSSLVYYYSSFIFLLISQGRRMESSLDHRFVCNKTFLYKINNLELHISLYITYNIINMVFLNMYRLLFTLVICLSKRDTISSELHQGSIQESNNLYN